MLPPHTIFDLHIAPRRGCANFLLLLHHTVLFKIWTSPSFQAEGLAHDDVGSDKHFLGDCSVVTLFFSSDE